MSIDEPIALHVGCEISTNIGKNPCGVVGVVVGPPVPNEHGQFFIPICISGSYKKGEIIYLPVETPLIVTKTAEDCRKFAAEENSPQTGDGSI